MTRILQVAGLVIFFGSMTAVPVWMYVLWRDVPEGLSFESSFDKRSVRAGETITMHGSVSVPPGCQLAVVRRGIDASGAIIHSSVARFTYRQEEKTSVILSDIQVPPDAAPGPAYLTRVMEWQCNWVQQLIRPTADIASIRFTILPPKEPETDSQSSLR